MGPRFSSVLKQAQAGSRAFKQLQELLKSQALSSGLAAGGFLVMNYFRTAGWTDEWIKAAELVTRATYAEKYQSRDIPPPTDMSDGADDESSSVRHPLACNACLTYALLDVWLRQYL